jgi:hypothetical protein
MCACLPAGAAQELSAVMSQPSSALIRPIAQVMRVYLCCMTSAETLISTNRRCDAAAMSACPAAPSLKLGESPEPLPSAQLVWITVHVVGLTFHVEMAANEATQ